MNKNDYRRLHKDKFRTYQSTYRHRHAEDLRDKRKEYMISKQSPRIRNLYASNANYREYRRHDALRCYYKRRIDFLLNRISRISAQHLVNTITQKINAYRERLVHHTELAKHFKSLYNLKNNGITTI